MTGRTAAVAEVSWDGHERGSLREPLSRGAQAVILADRRVASLWRDLAPLFDPAIVLLDAARNHARQETRFGDTLRFIPGTTAHFARKLILRSDDGGRSVRATPERVFCGGRPVVPPPAALRMAWDLMSEILDDMTAMDTRARRYAVGIELLTYPRSLHELDQVFDLLADSAGMWMRLGRNVDASKGAMVGLLDRFVIRDLAGWVAAMGASGFVRRIDGLTSDARRHGPPSTGRVLLKAHADAAKTLTALIGDRRRVRTEVFHDGAWVALPVTKASIAIFPSMQMEPSTRIHPTVHRVVMADGDEESASPHSEHTLSLTITDDPGDAWQGTPHPGPAIS